MKPMEIIHKVYDTADNQNFKSLHYGELDTLMAYELREKGTVYEVRVASYSTRAHKAVPETNLSQSFNSLKEALAWIEEIKKDIQEARSFHKSC
jgi:hypothetical protein